MLVDGLDEVLQLGGLQLEVTEFGDAEKDETLGETRTDGVVPIASVFPSIQCEEFCIHSFSTSIFVAH